jgi:hypothetical protein
MRQRGPLVTIGLTFGVLAAAILLLVTSALADLREPAGTATLAATLADEPAIREAVSDALVDSLLADAAERSPAAGGLLPLIRPLLLEAARTAAESPAGRAALTSALTDALRQLTFDGPIVVDLRAAVLLAAETAPAPLDTLALAAVEQGSVGVVVIGGGDADPLTFPSAPPTEEELRRVAGLPADVAIALVALLLIGLLFALVGRDAVGRPRRLLVAGASLLAVGASGVALLRIAPDMVLDRFAATLVDEVGAVAGLLPLLVDGLLGLLGGTTVLAGLLAVIGVGLSAAGTLAAVGRRRRT